jgi:hypothetical protein
MKFALFAFRKEPMCFIHVLLNALQLNKFGYEVKVVLEGEELEDMANHAGMAPFIERGYSIITF